MTPLCPDKDENVANIKERNSLFEGSFLLNVTFLGSIQEPALTFYMMVEWRVLYLSMLGRECP
jgi:hypothetical protein